jgi:hypothetical protein
MWRSSASLTLLLAGWLVLPAAAAWGHASGELPRARLSSEGRTVFLEWTAPPDDAADVGVAVGLLPEEAVVALLGASDEGLPTDQQIRELSRSDELRAYLLDNARVTQHGRSCDAEVEPGADFLTDGARFVFTCPDPVAEAQVEVTILHDRDELYATYSVDGTSQYAVHTTRQPEHPWDFTLAAEERTALEPALLVGGVTVAVVIGGALWSLGARGDRRGRGS